MKIIHTADWHLGQYFKGESREDEHRVFLAWLLSLLQKEQPDALLVAGDVFDTNNPPQSALTQYYQFLSQAQAFCPNIIITGGNHDSRQVLNAPKELLVYMNIHIIGGGAKINIDSDMAKQIIAIKNKQGNTIAAVAAVPFLRETEVRQAITTAETNEEKIVQLRQGMKAYYARCAELIQPYADLPLLAMGHLYAAGSQLTDDESEGRSERRIHVTMGNQNAIDTDIFPPLFQYIALGHIHQPQIVGKKEHIRYSGSPIPLSFGELNDKKQVVAVSFSGKNVAEIRPINVPTHRHLLRISGTPDQVIAQIALLDAPFDKPSIWAEIKVQVAAESYAVEQQIATILKDKNVIPLPCVRYETIRQNTDKLSTNNLLAQLNRQEIALEDINNQPESVFLQRCQHLPNEERDALYQTFEELLSQIAL